MRQYAFHWLDVFTAEPFGGNPLAVFPDAEGLSDMEMQNIARELNLSETTFVHDSKQPPAQYRVRIFTPINELPLAGHPVVGTHFLLAHLGRYKLQPPVTRVHQELGVGVLPVDLICPQGHVERVRMTQAPPKFLARASDLRALASALGLATSDLLGDQAWPQVVSTGVPQLMVPVRDLNVLGKIAPNLPALRALCDQLDTEMAYVFALDSFDQAARTHGRFVSGHYHFEDPVTGSASGAMGAYLVHYGLLSGNGNAPVEWIHEQGHFMQRPGRVYITIHGKKGNVQTVQVAGDAVIMGKGEIFLK
ncbi:MAG: PhzF family phenazine biosynthesis protein [candidate division KSB1 bacterium]|nr:PhzF family phenazine biosynthesis protein [candidate division KSB1 bacterium]MDZ7301703.1 PhzF family phenazine biosynthesis protein [candidate division KSB1 bacterium]MDZ7312410.1 PhzF family phenazine biosynthesis protein [candidate division KSB1 bacterium]